MGDLGNIHRLSVDGPAFLSPHGTGCSRYGDDLPATWQQAQEDGSQPSVLHRLTGSEIERLLYDCRRERWRAR